MIDFKRSKDGVPAKVDRDRVRPEPLGLHRAVCTTATATSATSSPRTACGSGMTVQSGPGSDITVGNALPLANIPVGTVVHNVELQPGPRRPARPAPPAPASS